MSEQTWFDPGRDGQPGWDLIKAFSKYASVLVETGSGTGGSAKECASYYDYIYSIEFSPVMYNDAKYNLYDVPNVTLIHGNSEEILYDTLVSLRPTHGDTYVLFLDAHISDINLALEGQSVTAIWKEMVLWEKAVNEGFNLYTLVDDARLFDGSVYPPQEWVKEFARKTGYTYDLITDVMVLTP